MSELGAAIAAAALDLVGCRFRLHGRDPATGLDCVGVAKAALAAAGIEAAAPQGYTLRNLPGTYGSDAIAAGLRPLSGEVAPGDIHLFGVGPAQVHLALAIRPDLFVHAHAGLGRVVKSAAPADWILLRRWRHRCCV